MNIVYSLVLSGATMLFYNSNGTSQVTTSVENTIPDFAKKWNASELGNNVFIFDPSMNMDEVQTLIDTLYNRMHARKSEFSTNRYALFFKPGNYHLDIKLDTICM